MPPPARTPRCTTPDTTIGDGGYNHIYSTGDFVQAACDMPSLAQGAHVLEIVLDADGEIPETREDSNRSAWETEVSDG